MRVESKYRQQAIFITCLVCITALFLSRAALSVSMFFLIGLCCIHNDFPGQVKTFFNDRFLLAISMLFFIPVITGLWSENLKEWADVMRLKLPLFFLPLAFAGKWQLRSTQWRIIGYVFILIVVIGSCWSFLHFLKDPATANDKYLRAKLFTTPLGNDHVRFSWIVSVTVLLIVFLWNRTREAYRWLLAIAAIWLVVYLHILSARTGLLSLYLMLFFFLVRYIFSRRYYKYSLISLALLIILPLLAWLFVPSFQNRIKYFNYDFSFVKRAEYLPGANDGNRFLSIRAGLAVLDQHPWGVGAGDVEDQVFAWYNNNVPSMLDSDKIYPSSEYLIYGIMAGWPGIIAFCMIMIAPLLVRNIRHKLFWFCLNATAAFSLMFDVGLEVQYGIFSYVFIVLWWWKWLKSNEQEQRILN